MKAVSKSFFPLFLITALAALSGCNGQGASPQATGEVGDQRQDAPPSVQTPTPSTDNQATTTGVPTPDPVPSPVAVIDPPPTIDPTPTVSPTPTLGASCVSSDPNHQCIGLKMVSYENTAGETVLSLDQAKTVIQGVNDLWKVCDIAFQIDEYVSVDPTQSGLLYGTGASSDTTKIRQTYSNNTTFLVVATGPWNLNYIAWTQLPGAGPYGVVVDADYSDKPVTVGHEIGHYMGLDDLRSSLGNIMYYIVYDTDTAITTSQCSTSRSTNLNYWKAMMRQ